MLPNFTKDGNLPPGIHEMSWVNLCDKFGFNLQRKVLLDGLFLVVSNLKEAGCKKLYIDGSFVTEKEFPNDIDGCWDTDNVDIGKIDPVLIDFNYKRIKQKMKYGCEFFPTSCREGGSGKTWIEFFQTNKATGTLKGIVYLNLEDFQYDKK